MRVITTQSTKHLPLACHILPAPVKYRPKVNQKTKIRFYDFATPPPHLPKAQLKRRFVTNKLEKSDKNLSGQNGLTRQDGIGVGDMVTIPWKRKGFSAGDSVQFCLLIMFPLECISSSSPPPTALNSFHLPPKSYLRGIHFAQIMGLRSVSIEVGK